MMGLADEIDDGEALHLITERQGGGSWFDRLLGGASEYSEFAISTAVAALLSAIGRCHSRGVIIRGISSDSIGFSDEESQRMKLFDFSAAIVFPEGDSGAGEVHPGGLLDVPIPTTFFTAPEVGDNVERADVTDRFMY